MSRKAISILMTVTVVVAIFIFASLFVVRPGAETGLFPVSAKAEKEEVKIPTEDEINEMIGREVERQVAEKLNGISLDGTDLDIEAFRKSIFDDVSKALIESEMGMMQALEEEVAALGDKISKEEVEALLEAKQKEILASFANADRAVLTSALDEMVTLEDDIYAYIDQKLQDMQSQINTWEPDYDKLVGIVAESLLAASENSDGTTTYDEIVYNVSTDVLSALAGDEAKTFKDLTDHSEKAYDAVARLVREVISRLEDEMPSFLSAEDEDVIGSADTETGIVVTDEETVPAAEEKTEEAAVEETSPAEEQKQPLITRPSFSFDEREGLIENRAKARDAAIDSILDAIRKNDPNF